MYSHHRKLNTAAGRRGVGGSYRPSRAGRRRGPFFLPEQPLPTRAWGVGSIDGARALHLSSSYLRAFFSSYLLGRPDQLMAGPSASFPEVHTERV